MRVEGVLPFSTYTFHHGDLMVKPVLAIIE